MELMREIDYYKQELEELRSNPTTFDMLTDISVNNHRINSTSLSLDDLGEEKKENEINNFDSSSDEKSNEYLILKATNSKNKEKSKNSKCPIEGCDGSGNTSEKKSKKGIS